MARESARTYLLMTQESTRTQLPSAPSAPIPLKPPLQWSQTKIFATLQTTGKGDITIRNTSTDTWSLLIIRVRISMQNAFFFLNPSAMLSFAKICFKWCRFILYYFYFAFFPVFSSLMHFCHFYYF